MKYVHIPKTKNVIFFLVFLTLSIVFNFLFLLAHNTNLGNNLVFISFLHLLLPTIYGVIFCTIFSYLIFSLETVISNLKGKLPLIIFTFLRIAEIFFGVLIILFASFQAQGQIEESLNFLKETFYFENLTPKLTDTFFLYWTSVCACQPMASSVILFVAAGRQGKIKKQIHLNLEEIQLLKAFNQSAGFDYEESDFYNQVNIPFHALRQTDGTRGEFEVYYMLRKSGLTNVTYIFNREIPKADGLSTELDLIIIHEKGIFVIENKHYTTRIYGNALAHDLTIIDHSGHKKSIYNPIRQNENHVAALKEFLNSNGLFVNDETTPIHSIVVFTAEGNDQTDDIISGIETAGTKTKVCTSQNVCYIINQLISKSDSTARINVPRISELLFKLPVRKKYS